LGKHKFRKCNIVQYIYILGLDLAINLKVMDDKTITIEVFTTRDIVEVEDVCFSNLC
jgi:hypothetical protein